MEKYKTKYLDGVALCLTEDGKQIIQERWAGKFAEIPHCDSSILHVPGTCEYCDHFPDWQLYRISNLIAFTGQDADKLTEEYIKEYSLPKENKDLFRFLPDPASYRRPLDTIEAWPGNVHENEWRKELNEAEYKKIEEEFKELEYRGG